MAIVTPNRGYIVAIIPYDEDIQATNEPNFETVIRHPDDLPNADLMAAAPTLYEELHKAHLSLMSLLPDQFDDDLDEASWKHQLSNIDHALTLARGETPV